MKKIAFLIPSMLAGGAERVMSILTNELSNDSNYKIYLITMETGNNFETLKNINRVYLSNYNGYGSKIIKLCLFFQQLFAFLIFLYKERPEIVVAFSERAIILNIFASFFHKHKVITSIRVHTSKHLENIPAWTGIIFKSCYKAFLNKSYKIISVSESAKEDVINNFNVDREKVFVIYNPYDIDKINELAQEQLSEDYQKFFHNSRVIINTGRLSKQKNQEELIEIFYNLSKKYDDIKLCILGEGFLKEKLLEKIANLGLEERILLTGFQKNPFPFLKNSNIFALTSLYEGFPNVLLEAMICGLPVVSYDCESGPKEILINDLQNLLVPTNDRKLFIKTLENLLNNNDLIKQYMIFSINRSNDFSKNHIIQNWKNIFDIDI